MPFTPRKELLKIRNPRPAYGFTLIELLVTITIGSVLLALILGGVTWATRASQKTRCVSNLRQVSIGFLQYTVEQRSNFPYWDHWFSAKSDHPNYPGIRDYLLLPADNDAARIDTTLTCPALQSQPETRVKEDELFHRTYTLNMCATRGHKLSLTNLLRIPQASGMIMIMDGSLVPGGVSNKNTYHVCHPYNQYSERLQAPHQQKLHASFLDGHIEAMTIEELLNTPTLELRWKGNPD